MEKTTKSALLYSLPFTVWMGLMLLLPPSAESYAMRSVATLLALVACWILHRKSTIGGSAKFNLKKVLVSGAIGIATGIVVFGLWIWLPAWPFEEPSAPKNLPYAPATCGWMLTIAKLAGSAFVIAPVEELFFRSFLYRWLITRDFTSIPLSRFDLSAFIWVVFLFTLEHDRPIAAAVTGVVYGILSIRFGLISAIAAHVTTNLILGLYVISNNAWQFW